MGPLGIHGMGRELTNDCVGDGCPCPELLRASLQVLNKSNPIKLKHLPDHLLTFYRTRSSGFKKKTSTPPTHGHSAEGNNTNNVFHVACPNQSNQTTHVSRWRRKITTKQL
jgi:hypothetical protein